MKKQLTILCMLAIAAMSTVYFTGCTNDTVATTGSAPSGLMATSLSNSSIGLMWTRPSDDNGTNTVVISNGATQLGTIDIASGSSTTITTINGQPLQAGVMYTFAIRNANGTSSPITWMIAKRTNSLQVWEKAAPSSLGFSGLVLNGAGGAAQVISFTGSGVSSTDFILENSGGTYYFESADAFDATYRHASMSDTAMYVAGGLDANYYSHDLSSFTYQTGGASTSIPDDATDYRTKGSKIKLVKTADGNYARIEIVPDAATGKLYSTSGGYRYVTVNVSYQSQATMPYAARPQPHVPEVGYGTPRHVTQ